MKARIENAASQLDITPGVQQIFKAIYAGGVPAQTLELVHFFNRINTTFRVPAGTRWD